MRGVIAAVMVAAIAVALPASTGSKNVELCHGAFENYEFSPNGRWLLYQAETERGVAPACTSGQVLGVVRVDGSRRRVLVRQGYPTWAWSPAGDRLALSIQDAQAGIEPRLLNVDVRTGVVRVRAKGLVGSFEWSPTGKWIALTRRSEDDRKTELLTGHLGEPGLYILAQDSGDFKWSPSGRWIAFTRGGSVVVSRPDGQSQHVFAQAGYPEWSPDGRWLEFTRAQVKTSPCSSCG